MAKQMTATGVKGHILSLIDEVAAGEQIEITKHGRTVARPGSRPRAPRLTGPTRRNGHDHRADAEVFSTGVAWDLP